MDKVNENLLFEYNIRTVDALMELVKDGDVLSFNPYGKKPETLVLYVEGGKYYTVSPFVLAHMLESGIKTQNWWIEITHHEKGYIHWQFWLK